MIMTAPPASLQAMWHSFELATNPLCGQAVVSYQCQMHRKRAAALTIHDGRPRRIQGACAYQAHASAAQQCMHKPRHCKFRTHGAHAGSIHFLLCRELLRDIQGLQLTSDGSGQQVCRRFLSSSEALHRMQEGAPDSSGCSGRASSCPAGARSWLMPRRSGMALRTWRCGGCSAPRGRPPAAAWTALCSASPARPPCRPSVQKISGRHEGHVMVRGESDADHRGYCSGHALHCMPDS